MWSLRIGDSQDLTSRPMQLVELVPLAPVAEGHHNASGKGGGGV